MTIRQFVGYAPNPKKGRRNQVHDLFGYSFSTPYFRRRRVRNFDLFFGKLLEYYMKLLVACYCLTFVNKKKLGKRQNSHRKFVYKYKSCLLLSLKTESM